MKKFFGTSLVLGLAVSALTAQTALNFGSLPLWFEADHSQGEASLRYVARTGNSEFMVSPTGATFVLRQAHGQTAVCTMQFVHAPESCRSRGNEAQIKSKLETPYVVSYSSESADPVATIYGSGELTGKINHLIGNHPAQWQTGVPTFGQVRVDNVYPGINVVYYGNGRQLEYDFNLAAGVDPRIIAIHFDGAEKVAVNAHGELVVSLNGGEVIQHQPVIYQTIGATRHEISGGYKLLDAHTVSFNVGRYDHRQPLVIDPILSFCTFFGGNYGDFARSIALDGDGNLYVAGETLSTIFSNAPAGGFRTNFQGGTLNGDAFIAKFDKTGTTNLYFTYLGGSSSESAYSIKVDHDGNAYVAGWTDSPDFPTNAAWFGHIAGQIFAPVGHYPADAFIAELNTNGSQLRFSTYVGGSAFDFINAIDLDSSGNVYFAGYTSSTDLPFTDSARQKKLSCTNTYPGFYNCNALIGEFSQSDTNRNYLSYFGGTNFDKATGIALDKANNIYVTGFTASTNFPIAHAITNYTLLNGATSQTAPYDAFVTKFSPGFSNLIYSTFLGGTNFDLANGIAVDGAGNAYVVGATISSNFPVLKAPAQLTSYVQTNPVSVYWTTNAFLTQVKFDAATTNTSIGFSTMFGGSSGFNGGYVVDVAQGVALDSTGNIYVVGSASSTNFPVTAENLYGSLRATNSGGSDVFVLALSSNAATLRYAAYLGGAADDFGNAIAADANGNAYVAGRTLSTDFPTFNAWQTQLNGTSDGFMAKITPTPLTLHTRLSGTNLLVSWPVVEIYHGVETSTNLVATNWLALTNPVVSNGAYTHTVAATNPAQFFRFRTNN